MAKEGLPARLRDLSECLWWDMGYEENHTHKDDRALLVKAADRIELADALADAVDRFLDTDRDDASPLFDTLARYRKQESGDR